jgi:hypothetical protein
MREYGYGFLEIPDPISKPRKTGMTFIRDPGISLTEQRMFLESAAKTKKGYLTRQLASSPNRNTALPGRHCKNQSLLFEPPANWLEKSSFSSTVGAATEYNRGN